MILSKISLHGFKSFARKVELRFDHKITAIVGPNGCGKTNIVDAIRWALGEQRSSVLRADRMEDVIFGGAHSSRPLGMAEVSLVFDNSKHILPIDYSEVVIRRRLYRSGDSEYSINKNQVRLKDIKDLFMDTGIGSSTYSVIELKMVEDILSDKAEDRRKLFDEAAGITKYKYRLKSAARKLESTRNDLLRVNDIINEVERNVASLKRQEQRARRFQTLQQELKELEIKKAAMIYFDLQEKMEPFKKKLSTLEKKRDGQTTEITKEEADLESLQARRIDSEKQVSNIRQKVSEMVERIHKRESDIRVGKERISSLEERIARYRVEIEELNKRLKDQEEHLEISQTEREALQVKITSTERIFNNKKKELDLFQQGLNLKRLDLNNKKKEIIKCLEQINRLNNDETRLRAKIDNIRGRLERLNEEDDEFRKTADKVDGEIEQLSRNLRELQDQRNAIVKKKDEVEKEQERIQNRIESIRERTYQEQGELDLLRGRRKFLQNVIESGEGLTDGAKIIIKDKPNGFRGVLADSLRIEPGHRSAIEVGLGEAARYLIFDTMSSGIAALKMIRERGGGNVTLVCLDRIGKLPVLRERPRLPDDADIVGWASDIVKFEGKVGNLVENLLSDLIIVRKLDTARRLIESAGTGTIRVATLDGELLGGHGFVRSGLSGGESEGIVGRLQRVDELNGMIEKLEKRLSDLKSRLKELEVKREKVAGDSREIERKLVEIESRVLSIDKLRAKNQFEKERAEKGLRRNGVERKRLLDEIKQMEVGLENLHPNMEILHQKRDQCEADSSHLQSEIDRLEEQEVVKEDEVHRLNLSVVRLKGDRKNLDYDIEHSKELIDEIGKNIKERLDEIKKAEEEIESLNSDIKHNESALSGDYSEKENEEERLKRYEEEYQKIVEELRSKEKEVREVRKDQDIVSETIHELEMQISDLNHQASSVRERILDAYGVRVEDHAPESGVDAEELDGEIEAVNRKIKGLGTVNMMALEEYREQKERLDFLNKQKDDLLSAEKTLRETIEKINRTARKRFEEIFSQVKINFQKTFHRFFQGGQADLRLEEGEDPLEARIDIIARPAGKHFRDLALLSGGERALTAISLLFALYLVKPSPLCILDEIDAPLDDANVERFTGVLADYAKETQFIIVTHNRMTMKVAGSLYGVTMEEEGVSKLVSVKFEDAEKVSGE